MTMTDTVPNAVRRPRRDWHLLWAASAVSTLGDGAFVAVLPLLAASMTSDPRLIAGVTAWGTLPWLLAALPAGALADRWDARRTMARFQVAQALLLGALAAVTLTAVSGVAVLYAVAFAVGLAETMVKVSAQKLVPAVVGARDLERANGRQNATVFANRMFVGPPLGALLFSLAASLPLWLCASTFTVSAALVWRIRARTEPGRRRTLRVEIGEGVRWLGSNRLLRTLSLLSGAANLANFMAMATFVLFARERLGVSDAAYGVVVALTGVGGVLGSLLSGRIVATLGSRRTVTITIFTTPVAMIALGLFARDVLTLTLLASVTSFGASLWNVSSSSVRQRMVPAALMGRVSSVGLLMAWGTQPLGALLGGFVAGWWGLAAPWLIAGAVRLAAAFLALRPLASWPPEPS
ncbi:MFS transporter [Catellatospora sp. IY07-71]|uniref:MFS transporter n=1 Tax=Catellatospora sp. IY07-71 TaxID=2728827 RepID=UPI001BB4312C|nr:MFS transporter [Catellatospora sp. IY07-71]BCJ76417.1 MFS transporter [Catellatospora sp. IY07-71]